MQFKTPLSIGFLVAGLMAGGTLLATAQTDAVPAPAVQAQETGSKAMPVHKAGMFDGAHKKGGRGGRGGDGPMLGGALLAQADTNDDGTISKQEIDALRSARVTSADANSDGALEIEEFDSLYRELTRERMVDAFQRLDADGNGSVDAAEVDAVIGHMFDRMDRNGDGAISSEDRGRPG